MQADNIVLNPSLKTYADRSKNVDAVLRDLRSQKVLNTLNGWRDEVWHYIKYKLHIYFISQF